MKRGQDPNWRHMMAVASKFPLNREEHLTFVGMVVGREIRSRKELSPAEVRIVVAAYEGYLLMASHMRDIRGSGRRFEEPEEDHGDEAADPPSG